MPATTKEKTPSVIASLAQHAGGGAEQIGVETGLAAGAQGLDHGQQHDAEREGGGQHAGDGGVFGQPGPVADGQDRRAPQRAR